MAKEKKETLKKSELIIEAQNLGIEITDEDTIKTLQEKIVKVQSGELEAKESIVPNLAEEKVSELQGLKYIKVTREQLKKLEAEGKLYGYNPKTSEAIIK